MLKELKVKEKRLRTAFVDGYINPQDFQLEFDSIKAQMEDCESKIVELNDVGNAHDNRDDLRLIFNLKELEKKKYKSHYACEKGLWKMLDKEQKYNLINKYIASIEVEKGKDKDDDVIIKNINFRKSELKNMLSTFRSDCFDMLVNINNQDVILSNYKTENEISNYVNALSEFYKVSKISLEKDLLDVDELLCNNKIQIIPNTKNSKFDKEVYTILQIS